MEENPISAKDVVKDLGSDEESSRKMAAFRLQNLIGDPSFADAFISEGGVQHLRYLALKANGNTLAYSLAAWSNLLGVDQGWEWINSELIHRVNLMTVELDVKIELIDVSASWSILW